MKTFLRQLTHVALMAAICSAACGTASAANTWVVTSAADDGGPDTLRYAIYFAQDGDTIVFDSSLNGKTIGLSGTELLIDKDLTIQGPGPDKLAISGGFGTRVFEVDGGVQVTISGLSMVDGAGVPHLFTGTVAWSGNDVEGGAICNYGNLTLNNCVVTENGWYFNSYDSDVVYGGGIANYGSMTINDSTVTNNACVQGSGGGIYNVGTMEINGSSVFDNYLEGYAGTLYINNIYNAGTLKLHHSYVQKPHKN